MAGVQRQERAHAHHWCVGQFYGAAHSKDLSGSWLTEFQIIMCYWRNVTEQKRKCRERSSGGEQEWRAGRLWVELSLVLDTPIQLQHLSLSLSSPSLTLVLPPSGSVASWAILPTLVSVRPPLVFTHETILETFPLLHRHVQFGQNADFWRPLGSRKGSWVRGRTPGAAAKITSGTLCADLQEEREFGFFGSHTGGSVINAFSFVLCMCK